MQVLKAAGVGAAGGGLIGGAAGAMAGRAQPESAQAPEKSAANPIAQKPPKTIQLRPQDAKVDATLRGEGFRQAPGEPGYDQEPFNPALEQASTPRETPDEAAARRQSEDAEMKRQADLAEQSAQQDKTAGYDQLPFNPELEKTPTPRETPAQAETRRQQEETTFKQQADQAEIPAAAPEEPRRPITHPANLPVEKVVQDSMGAATSGSPSVSAGSFMAAPLAKAKAGWDQLAENVGAGRNRDLLGAIAGREFPTMTRLGRTAAEAATHVGAAREYALARGKEAFEGMVREARAVIGPDATRAQGETLAHKAWSVLAEDNFRGRIDELKAQGRDAEAAKVKSLIGTSAPGLGSEKEFQAAIKDPQVLATIKNGYEPWRPELEGMYRQGTGIEPGANLDTRGRHLGVRINQRAVVDSEGNLIAPGKGGAPPQGGLRNPLSRKPSVSREMTGRGGAYNVNAEEGLKNSFLSLTEPAARKEFEDHLEKNNLAKFTRGYGEPVAGKNGEKWVPFQVQEAKAAREPGGKAVLTKEGEPVTVQPKVMWVDPRVAADVRKVYNVDQQFRIPVITKLLNTNTGASLLGLGEAAYHTGTLLSGVQRAFNLRHSAGGAFLNSGFIRLGRSLAAVGQEAINAMRNTPESLSAASERARIGASRPMGPESKVPIARYGQKYIHGLDYAARAAIQKMAHEAADMGVIPKTETSIRSAITQNVGQYNSRLKGLITDALQQSGTMPFLGTQKAQLGLMGRFFTGSTGVMGEAPKLRANHLASLAGTLMQVGAMSYFLSGNFFGRKGVPIGDIDTGKNDKKGNPIVIPTTMLLGLTAFKRSGVQKAVTGLRDGRNKGLIADDTATEIENNLFRLFGPGVKTAFTGLTGRALTPNLQDVTPPAKPGSFHPWENIKTAAAQGINPAATKLAAAGLQKAGFPETGQDLREYAGHPEEGVLQSQIRTFAPQTAKIPNDAARLRAQEKEYQQKARRQSRNQP
jgi:hypothetical protein